MRLALLDTNIVVSAAIQRLGPSGQIVLKALDGQIQLVTCPSIIVEYREVVRRPHLAKKGLPPEWLDFLVEMSLQLPDPEAWPYQGPDPHDLVFLALAKASGAILVTGNTADYPRDIRSGVKVLSPREYWERLKEG